MSTNLQDLARVMRLELGPIAAELEREPARIIEATRERIATGQANDPGAADTAILHILARSASDQGLAKLPADVLALAARWLTTRWKEAALVTSVIGQDHPHDLVTLLEQIVDAHPDAVASAITGSLALDQTSREGLLLRIAKDPREGVREHLFALIGQHRRLVPPGSVSLSKAGDPVVLELLRTGITDASPAVRERAIAAAYGLGKSEAFVDLLAERASDEHSNVRQYALVALGATTGQKSLTLLLDRFANGTRAEMTSALWALARRPDGIEHVLDASLAERPWLLPELANSIAEVAVPLSDAQLERIGLAVGKDFAPLAKRHIARTRNGSSEVGPDARMTYTSAKPKPMRDQLFVTDPAYDALAIDRLRALLANGTKPERARAIGAIARRAATHDELLPEAIAAMRSPAHRAMTMMGTISIAHVGVACLAIAGGSRMAAPLAALLEDWPEPDRTDLRWFLKSQQIDLAQLT